MALTTTLHCDCGKTYVIYIPKRILFKEIFKGDGVGYGSGVVFGKMLDQQETKRGEIELAQEEAELDGYEFRNINVNEVIQCECGAVFDMLRAIQLDIKYQVLRYEEVRTGTGID